MTIGFALEVHSPQAAVPRPAGLRTLSKVSQAVFLSYASQAAEVARRIADALRAAGVEACPERFLAPQGPNLDKVPKSGTLWFRRMRVISRKKLRLFWEKHVDAEQALRAWFHEARGSTWKSFNDIKSRHRSADLLPGNRVVFDIKGNTYRLIVRIHFNTGIVFIRFVGTHAEYDRIDAASI